MSAQIIQFAPRSNPKADRAFWIGCTELEQMAIEIIEAVTIPADTAPCEYSAPSDDCA